MLAEPVRPDRARTAVPRPRALVGDPAGYRPDIDGLRAIAVVAVVGFHAFPPLAPGGFVGVDVFFVISGYLITGNVLRTLGQDRFSLTDFYARRIRRIFPALSVVLLAATAIGWVMLTPREFASLGRHILASAGFASNFLSWSEAGYFDTSAQLKPLLHIWSLGIEEQFYLVWPLLLWLLWTRRRSCVGWLTGLSLASMVLNVVLTARDPVAAFYLPLSRAWELGAGGVLASSFLGADPPAARRAWWRDAMSALGLALIVTAIVAIDSSSPFPGWRAMVPVAGAVLVIAAGAAAAPNRLLRQPLVVWVGLISYPLYLWHWLLLSFTFIARDQPPTTTVRLVVVVLSVILAALTYLLVERPIRRAAIPRLRVYALTAAMAGVAVLGVAIASSGGVPVRFPVAVRALMAEYDFKSDARVGQCWVALDSAPDSHDSSCFSTAPGRPSVLVWGDSHGARLYPGLVQVYGGSLSIEDGVRNSCPPRFAPPQDSCARGNEYVLGVVEQQRPDLVILFAVWPSYPDELIQAVPGVADRILAVGGQRVLVVGPAPLWTNDLPTLMFKAWALSGRQAIPRWQKLGLRERPFDVDRMMRDLPWRDRVSYVSLTDLLCGEKGCLTRVPGSDGALLSWDYGHLTTAGAAYVALQLDLDRRIVTPGKAGA